MRLLILLAFGLMLSGDALNGPKPARSDGAVAGSSDLAIWPFNGRLRRCGRGQRGCG